MCTKMILRKSSIRIDRLQDLAECFLRTESKPIPEDVSKSKRQSKPVILQLVATEKLRPSHIPQVRLCVFANLHFGRQFILATMCGRRRNRATLLHFL